ncbi:hypothetical protein [Loigolactobacillus coryniformis]|uniref:hypothetical protein n=1 Tax=Loigolactobacillus coryniformis TaxID=1610 RepID=UPI0003106C24|nr:hypothetical protein [Loigolactobacillus coryniformis]
MANKYNITKGTQNWNVNANNFMNEYFGSDSGYLTAGITYFNGTKVYTGATVGYQALSSVSGVGLVTFGEITIPSTLINNNGTKIDGITDNTPVVKLPLNIKLNEDDQWYAPCTGGAVRLRFNQSDNSIGIYTFGFIFADNTVPTGNVWINISHLFPIHK